MILNVAVLHRIELFFTIYSKVAITHNWCILSCGSLVLDVRYTYIAYLAYDSGCKQKLHQLLKQQLFQKVNN